MKTEVEIRGLIDHLEESLHDHHLFLNEQHVIDIIFQSTDYMIGILKWVVGDEVQSSTQTMDASKGESDIREESATVPSRPSSPDKDIHSSSRKTNEEREE